MKFFNPRLSVITFAVSINKGTVQIGMAKTTNSNFSGRPTKGQKIYDWDNTAYFSLQPIECINILNNLQDLLNGTYVNHREKMEKFKKCLVITHFRDDQPSRLIIDRSLDSSGSPTGSVVMTLLPPKGTGAPVSYVFRHDEMLAMKFYLTNGAKNLDFYKDMRESLEKIEFAKNKKSGKNNRSYDSDNYNPPSSYSGTTFEEPTPPPDEGQSSPKSQSVGDVSDMKIDW